MLFFIFLQEFVFVHVLKNYLAFFFVFSEYVFFYSVYFGLNVKCACLIFICDMRNIVSSRYVKIRFPKSKEDQAKVASAKKLKSSNKE